jgi:hypothetical protein
MLIRSIVTGSTLVMISCAPVLHRPETATASKIQQLWRQPADLASRSLYYGVGGRRLAPDARGRWTFVNVDLTGASGGYDVRDEKGHEWSVKMGVEVQPEIVVSRLLWAIGFHQPPTYYLPAGWTLSGEIPHWVLGATGPQGQARFRPRLEKHEVVGEWSWYDNPFIGTREFKALVIANVLVNNWDFKASNNKVYRVSGTREDGSVRYVVRDLGASLGREWTPPLFRPFQFRLIRGTKNDINGFESQGFIRRVEGSRVEFDYHGLDSRLLKDITPQDVRWTCGLFTRLTAAQWDDAFRAAGYDQATRRRYIRKIQDKLEEGARLKG